MAGGQERISERIRSIQATKKITRAMELIAASRIVKAQARVAAAVPYSDQITEVVKDLAAGGASTDSPLLAGRSEIKHDVLRGHHRRPWSVRRLQLRRAARRPRARSKPTSSPARTTRSFRSARRPRATSASVATPSARRSTASPAQPTLRGRPGDRRVRRRPVTRRARSTRSSSSTPASSRRARQEVVLRPLVPLSDDTVAGGDGKAGSTDGSGGDYEFEPDPVDDPRHAAARATSRPASTPRCSTPRRPSTPSASGR